MIKHTEINILKSFSGHKAGTRIRILVTEDGIPQERFWRARLKDAKIDKCCEIHDPDQKKESKKAKPKKSTKTPGGL